MTADAQAPSFDLNVANAVLAASNLPAPPQEFSQIAKLDSAGAAFHAHCLYSDAELCYRTALDLRRAHNINDLTYLENLHRLGVLSRQEQNFTDAENFHLEAIALVTTMFGPNHPRVADQNNYLAGIYYAWDRNDDAARVMHESLALYEKLLGSDSLPVGLCHFALALIYHQGNKRDKSLKHFALAEDIVKHQVYSQNETIEEGLLGMAISHFRHHDISSAETLFRHSIILREEMLWPFHPLVPETLTKLGTLYELRGLHEKAGLCFETALKKQQDAFGEQYPGLIDALTRLETFHSMHGDRERARLISEQILDLQSY